MTRVVPIVATALVTLTFAGAAYLWATRGAAIVLDLADLLCL